MLDRTVAARNGLPELKPYVYRGTGEDVRTIAQLHAEIAAKSPEHAALVAGWDRRRAEEATPDPAPGYEWHRELAEDQELAELAAERDRYQAAMAAAPAPPPEPVAAPVAAASRCRKCKYLTTSAGHRVMCDD